MNSETQTETGSGEHPREWKYSSSHESGLHLVISPENSACKTTWAYRLNLSSGESHSLSDQTLELNAAIIQGEIELTRNGKSTELGKLDSFYLPANDTVVIKALKEAVLFIGGAPYEGIGEFFIRPFDPDMALGEIHQIHGEPPYQREVFMTLNPETPASRMINGFTWGESGMWTSWPPHQHTEDLEEIYCYFDLPSPEFALHLCSRIPGKIEAVHPVSTGDFVAVPEGYHPTVGSPGARSCYFWIMAAHRQESRRYDLAKADFKD